MKEHQYGRWFLQIMIGGGGDHEYELQRTIVRTRTK